ncbi:coiled-coil domain-containing protein 190 isoform X2 [Lepisosteus oculatus]|uniref:coiled-coil domain-containing protein 190 isoform X2 n=1 Tax=Lepisosteus oculatus TaxID=7918 RepID=UPI0007403AD8|nr:PREDICTED: coiled-coil domain-containing protein C1orf110 homolog isoform X2 [Lepisosteus oculatus]
MRGLDEEWREARRGEARLAQGLQRLEAARLYHVNSLLREQRRLQRDLGALRHGNSWRKMVPSLGSRPHDPLPVADRPVPPYKRAFLPTIPQGGKEPNSLRSQKALPLRTEGPALGLQARVREFVAGGSHRGSLGESSAAPLCLPDVRAQTAARLSSSARGEGEQEPPPAPDPEALAPDGRLRTVYTLPSFPQALSEARKARYLRHRGQPECERELSLREIFARPVPGGKAAARSDP